MSHEYFIEWSDMINLSGFLCINSSQVLNRCGNKLRNVSTFLTDGYSYNHRMKVKISCSFSNTLSQKILFKLLIHFDYDYIRTSAQHSLIKTKVIKSHTKAYYVNVYYILRFTLKSLLGFKKGITFDLMFPERFHSSIPLEPNR